MVQQVVGAGSPHVFVAGQTMSGKSSYVRAIFRAADKAGIPTIAFDPTLSSDWPERCAVYDEEEAFFAALDEHPPGYVAVDEADELFSIGQKYNFWLAKKGRHYGWRVFIISQRPQMVAPTVRGQCGEYVVFSLGADDADALARDKASPGLKAAPDLRQGEFLRAYWRDGQKVVDRARLW